MIDLNGTPYSISSVVEKEIVDKINQLIERLNLLRNSGKVSFDTLERYYGKKRFELVAESNAIEGSTLSVGETEVAILKGVTITGHDPAYVRDAVALDKALNSLYDIAREKQPLNIQILKKIHEHILGDRPSAGEIRNEPVRIKGSEHKPPVTWREIIENLEKFEEWSKKNENSNCLIRATILHAWLAHIHPFIDGNGRTARAVMTLELIRGWFPTLIIKRSKDRDRYIDTLKHSDIAGDIAPFFELILEKAEFALIGLELSASEVAGYSFFHEKIKKAQIAKLNVWNRSLSLLIAQIGSSLDEKLKDAPGEIVLKEYEHEMALEDYLLLCERKPIPKTWVISIEIKAPSLKPIIYLLWIGFRSDALKNLSENDNGGPSLFWSIKNPNGFPQWIKEDIKVPNGISEFSNIQGIGDEWYINKNNEGIKNMSTSELSDSITDGLIDLLE